MKIAQPVKDYYSEAALRRGWPTRAQGFECSKAAFQPAYAESKLHDAMLAFAVARLWPDVCSNSLEPGWVPIKMGGPVGAMASQVPAGSRVRKSTIKFMTLFVDQSRPDWVSPMKVRSPCPAPSTT
jgi:NAD(P)-dependent dehydrogenase (short-subunit alcohol dehydrogenase family)